MNTTNIIIYITVFLVLKLTLKFLFYCYYLKLGHLKKQKYIKTLSFPIEKIIALYIDENYLNIRLDYTNNKTFFHFKKNKYQKKTFYIDSNTSNYFYLDKILGQLWLINSKKHDRNYFFYRFFGLYYYLIVNLLFYLNLILQIILLSIKNIYPNNAIINIFNNYNLYFILSFLTFLLYISNIIFSLYVKKYYDSKYDKDIDRFLLKYFSKEIINFIEVRNFHRKIIFTIIPIWYFNVINNSNTCLGPFITIV